jgi:acetylornithine/succinyldiaminopimelate/putrescine aminotransferase
VNDARAALRSGFDDFREFVNPFIANRAELAREPIRFVRAEAGSGRLVDEDGKSYEDLHGTQAFGHRHPAIAQAVKDLLETDAPFWFPSRVNPFAGRLARRLCERSGHYSNVYFGCTGSDAVEASLKLARAATKKPRILSLTGGYHGCTFGSVALMNRGPFRDPFGPHLPGAEAVAWNDVDDLRRAMTGDDVAAVVVEPIQGEGGVRALSEEFIAALCELTEKHDAVLVADEVQTALGRSGHFLRTASWPRRPDVALLGKALGGGLMPISAMLTRRDLFERAYGSSFEAAESHNSTFSYNAVSAVAAMAALDLLTDDLIAQISRRGAAFREALREALADDPIFVEARGDGYMMGIALKQPDHPWISFEQLGFAQLADHATIGPLLCHRLYKRGFFAFVCGHDWSVLRLQPRFTIEESRLAELVTACREELAYIGGIV